MFSKADHTGGHRLATYMTYMIAHAYLPYVGKMASINVNFRPHIGNVIHACDASC